MAAKMTDDTLSAEHAPSAEGGTGAAALVLAYTRNAFIGDERHGLANGSTLLGRGAPLFSRVALDDARLSRGHARIERVEGSWFVEDLGSHNGTRLNGRQLTGRAPLAWGDVLRMGDTLFVFAEASEAPNDKQRIDGLVGRSAALTRLHRDLERAARYEQSVLILGETGTGKEVVARALHELSGRAGPFIALNCGGVAESVLDSELFGHVRGAFTGAAASRDGLLREAHGGTLFLDELGEMPPMLQVKLLRVLETRQVRALGGTQELPIDVRVLAATHRDLVSQVNEAAFRADLYARLVQWRLLMPPLRERREDIAPLARHLLGRMKAEARPIDVGLAEALLLHDWPLNVRGLLNVLSIAVIASDGGPLKLGMQVEHELKAERRMLTARTLAPTSAEEGSSQPPAPRPARAIEATPLELETHLRAHQGKVAEVARHLGCSRQQVYRWIEDFGLELDHYRVPPPRPG
ncbi:FHA domain-containing protein [Corallococcus exiguus]|uniref:FHA domain-containing protein n=2 Tax=Corallococcus exiguus TaxID=83462 RepID=A0A7X5BU06_9BACT|nr:FHA domain-containing protein [Corallococcus exiguus]TNV60308.1 FHA domain-containing protein [Corallococcus exiguus]